MSSRSYDWPFSLPRTHTGMLLGNGVIGLMVWGEGNTLRLTIGRADAWDHRGGNHWTDEMSFANIRRLLEAGDAPAIRDLFKSQAQPGEPARSTMLPLGRVELEFTAPIDRGTLDLNTGVCTIHFKSGLAPITIELSMNSPLIRVSASRHTQVRYVTSWDYVGDALAKVGYQPPRIGDDGWEWDIPGEAPIAIQTLAKGDSFWIACDRGRAVTARQLAAADARELQSTNAHWWQAYWADAPRIDVPDASLTFLLDYGLYKFAGLTNPTGIAATLQGPWVEEYQLPPWSNDYHFNINVQMCYAPAYRSGKLNHLRPLFDMVWGWRDTLRENARKFIGIADGYVLPHATNDRCEIIGNFWTGTIDHGCTAWIGKMMFDYYLYTGDESFLRERAYPFMVGAMRVYEEMLERTADGFSLPVSVSPEYRGAAMNAWGVNASFQLACIHWLCEALEKAAKILGESPRPIWAEIHAGLPKACVESDGKGDEIRLWQKTPLEESHRHHSHLAGLLPFDVIDVTDPAWRPIIERSLQRWVHRGMGQWSGWCMPWAAQLHTLTGNADMAVMIVEIWRRVFTNLGHGTLHDCNFPGFTLIGAGRSMASNEQRSEIMQMDAGMGIASAIMDFFVQTRRGVNYLFAGIPKQWSTVAFDKIHTEGGFILSAQRTGGRVEQITIRSSRSGELKLADPWSLGTVRTISMNLGEELTLRPS